MNPVHNFIVLWSEIAVLVLGLAMALVVPDAGSRLLSPFRTIIHWMVRRPLWATVFSFSLAPFLRLLAWPLVHLRYPAIHDEFSFLLLGDTFASGRLTNPTHPFWIHFETMHVIQRPTYASIYPVVQGVFLAIGEGMAHAPWLGVWLSMALFCAALYWMLRAWVPRFWAIAGTALATVRFGIFSYWMNSYWGGTAAALGGALLLGALPRVFRYRRMRDAFWLALGSAILANSRPYEGFFFCLPVVVVFLAWGLGSEGPARWFGFRLRRDDPRSKRNVVAVLVLSLAVAAVGMGYYFWRVTGNPLKMPYSVEAEQYGITPLFVWQDLRPEPHYNNATLRYFFVEWAPTRASLFDRLHEDWRFYVGPALSLPLLASLAKFRRGRTRFLLAVSGAVVVAVAIEWWSQPHYISPMTAALYALLMQGLRQLRAKFGRYRHAPSRWRGLITLAPLVVVIMIAVRIALSEVSIPLGSDALFDSPTLGHFVSSRSQVENFLLQQGGKNLILVRYTNHENARVHAEWVYNTANIDRQAIVWARELDEEHNRKLREYYKDRKAWLCSPDERMLVPLD